MIICYTDSNITLTPEQSQKWVQTNNIQTFLETHAFIVIDHIFIEKADYKDTILNRQLFEKYATSVGLSRSDYLRTITLSNGDTTRNYMIIGINPRNTKYKVLVLDTDTGDARKIKTKYILDAIREQY